MGLEGFLSPLPLACTDPWLAYGGPTSSDWIAGKLDLGRRAHLQTPDGFQKEATHAVGGTLHNGSLVQVFVEYQEFGQVSPAESPKRQCELGAFAFYRTTNALV